MNKLLLLIKNNFKMFINSFARRRNKKSVLGGAFIVLMFCALFISMFVQLAITQTMSSLQAGVPELSIYSCISTGIVFSVLVVVLKATNNKKTSDNDLLLSLPFKKSTIVMSKIVYNIFFDFLTISFVLIPGFVVYFIFVDNTNYFLLINGFILIVLISLLANSLSILLRTFISFITKGLKQADLITTIINVIIIITFIGVYYYYNLSFSNIQGGSALRVFNSYPVRFIANYVLNNNLVNFALLTIVCVVPFAIGVVIETKSLNKSNTTYYTNSGELVYKKNSLVKSLFKKEINRYFRSTIYVVNTIITGVFLVFVPAILIILGKDYILTGVTGALGEEIASSVSKLYNIIVVLGVSVLASGFVLTYCSISIEGKQIWILKAHPINPKDIFNAKILQNLVVGGVSIIIATILLCFVISIEYVLFALVIMTLAMIYGAQNGLLCNLEYPKLDWKSEEEIVKKGLALFVSLATNIIPMLILSVLFFLVKDYINPLVYLSFVTLAMVVINILKYKRLLTKGVRLFNNI